MLQATGKRAREVSVFEGHQQWRRLTCVGRPYNVRVIELNPELKLPDHRFQRILRLHLF